MDTLKKIVRNQYFPAGAVLAGVILFWLVGILGGLSLLHNNQPPLTTLTWMLFVYTAAVLTPLAGLLAAIDLVRRWRRNRAGAGLAAGEEELFADERPSAETIVPAEDPFVPAEGPYDQARPAAPASLQHPETEGRQQPAPEKNAKSGEPAKSEMREQQARPATPPRPAGNPGASQKKPKQPGGRKAA